MGVFRHKPGTYGSTGLGRRMGIPATPNAEYGTIRNTIGAWRRWLCVAKAGSGSGRHR